MKISFWVGSAGASAASAIAMAIARGGLPEWRSSTMTFWGGPPISPWCTAGLRLPGDACDCTVTIICVYCSVSIDDGSTALFVVLTAGHLIFRYRLMIVIIMRR